MAVGPLIIFDKSTLQSLNPDEAVWLENFFLTNITPLFFIETLADLEKAVRSGRTPEHVVGSLAYKTPALSSYPNVHHATLLAGELTGAARVAMRGFPVVSGGVPMAMGDKKGIMFKQAPETEALQRWQRGQFLDLERQIAKAWRRALSGVDWEEQYQLFQQWFIGRAKPKTLSAAKTFADSIIDGEDRESVLRLGLALIGVPSHSWERILERWRSAGTPPIGEFAPYFRHVFSVDLFFFVAIAADLISRARPSNKIDLAYLYYLPFCMVFASSDRLHARTAPIFLRVDQTFVEGSALKEDLARLDEHYSLLPDEVKNQGVMRFASYPPVDESFLVTRLWDKHLPVWRRHQAERTTERLGEDAQARIVDELTRFEREAVPLDPTTPISADEADKVLFERRVYPRKGKWKWFPPEVEQSRRGSKA